MTQVINTEGMTREQLEAWVASLTAENKVLKQKGQNIKVSDKGGVSVYGLGRFPVTLYRGQWEKLFAKVDDIKAFIAANADSLSVKAE